MNISGEMTQGAPARATTVKDQRLLRRERPLHMGVVERNNGRCRCAQCPFDLSNPMVMATIVTVDDESEGVRIDMSLTVNNVELCPSLPETDHVSSCHEQHVVSTP
jgi:hypothetical protein